MSRKKGKLKGIYIVGLLWLLSSWIGMGGVLAFFLLFGISLSVIVGLARLGAKKDQQTDPGNRAVIDTTASPVNNMNPYSSTYHQSAQAQAQADAAARQRAIAEEQARLAAQFSREKAQKEQDKNYTAYGALKRKRTGDKDIDALLDEEERAIFEMRRLDDAIVDEKVSAQIVHLEEVTSKIVDCIVEKPKKRNQVKKFFNYYLPTTLKLLNSYDRMDDVGISGENIDGTKGSIETLMDTALAAFDKELDALYGDEAIDVTSDIKVMESMLAQDGLTDDELKKLMK